MAHSLPLFPEKRFRSGGIRIRASDAVSRLARRLWPSKTVHHLASRCDVSARAAGLWLEGSNNISADALVELLRSDVGYDLLTELMDGSRTAWWREFQRGVRISEIEKKMEWQRAQIAALKAEIAG